ncbi:MAG: hypothetical protein DI538_14480 [Azospira oryzae]|jgi:hypothetical protein|nr:MAG: hypothetical protein DI538_14480 [Azospira oryzae]
MKLKVIREGGFIPQVLEKEVDLHELPEKLNAIVANFTSEKQQGKINPQLRDGYRYTLEWTGKNSGSVQFDDTTLPNHLHEVINYLLKLE